LPGNPELSAFLPGEEMDRFIKWAEKEYPLGFRLLGTLAAGLFFVILLPLALITLGPALDRSVSLEVPGLGLWPVIIGISLMLVGAFFALWSIYDQLLHARGTPLPVMATQKLLVSGPFRLCRNPMSFGAILLYLGIGITIASPGTLLIVIVLSALLLTYLQRVEEKELEARFGQAYLEYKEQTPFLFPRIIR
jgi:protein-S-isoprenylcysteine O-methyltransferase Ste14